MISYSYKDSIIANMQSRIQKSIEYKQLIDSAKTKTKKQYLLKKLKKNNEIIAKLSKSLNKLTNKGTV